VSIIGIPVYWYMFGRKNVAERVIFAPSPVDLAAFVVRIDACASNNTTQGHHTD